MHPTRESPPQLLVATPNHGPGPELLALAERRGYTVRRAHTGAQALEQAHAVPPDLVALDESLFFFQAEDGIRDVAVTGVQTCALPISVLTRRMICAFETKRLLSFGNTLGTRRTWSY